MKNSIFVKYNIKVEKIYSKDSNNYFFNNNQKYYIVLCNHDLKYLKTLYDLTNRLYLSGIRVNTFILNKDKEFYSKWNNKILIIIKENDIEDEISLNKIKRYNINNNLIVYNPMEEWKNEIDTLENEIIEYNKEFPLIQESFNYFIGMGENAIQFVEQIKNKINIMSNSIGHKVDDNLFNDYNINDPFNFIRVNKTYDISNYIKYKLFGGSISFNEISEVFSSLNDDEIIYLFSCLLYPNYYFELIKKILLKDHKEDDIMLYISKRDKYRQMLSFCQKLVKNRGIQSFINWIDK